ncbi:MULTISPECIES: MarR family transcriptional regulator [Sphingomonadales]|jgi:DNA repair protein RadC|uniref:DNA repair protein RadC n=1 Tax=Sphingobium chungbukense TaxID=56193 RepID=A0A0M3ANE0_9SPHN|nr:MULTISPECIES: helix-turn-helix domain-containing protein [Sphingomonadaceae]EJU11270.1 DNA repair protein RadC [Sphingomonas sp. LH128]KKW90451.1 DNA repair protein RadC [Sphingobium chungbukense]ODU67306.1 MAG: DNA repair protein RadC [Novosphingobium sp. SCN 66-18]OJY68332.1 MAG: DNA repair protein RadC [Sphingobium sp. 66-54]|tara:strand:- start:3346 stop:3696 length:351 start_codon:yes stop_codon:yes gene_type:complete
MMDRDTEHARDNAKRLLRRRTLRKQLVGAHDLFGEPAWEMLIDLFIHECERKPLSISAVCVTAGLPMSSALRLIQKLCDAGLVSRIPDPVDGRRCYIRLDPPLMQRLRAYFSAGDL